MDCGSDLYRANNPETWKHVKGGDGMEQAIDYINPNTMYSSNQKGFSINRTTNGYNNSNPFYYPLYPNNNIAQFVNPYTFHSTDPNLMYFGYQNVWIRDYTTGTGNWVQKSDWESDFGLSLYYCVQEIEAAPSNGSVVYASLGLPPTGLYGKLFKTSVAGGSGNWEEITPIDDNGLNVDQYITGIAIDPFDSERVWISYSGFDELHKVKFTSNGGTSWEEIGSGKGLPNIPINHIIVEHGSNDLLFVATDVGIFYKDETMEDWISFNEGLPNVEVQELEINYLGNKLRAATYGRGLWETEISEEHINYNLQISSDMIITRPLRIRGDLYINEGVTLTVKGKILFANNSKLVVERGGKIRIDGGILTNVGDDNWKGIELWGNAAQDQSYSYQGTVEVINGGTIENAKIGINTIRYALPDGKTQETPDYAYTGGMLFCDGAIFKNNEIAVKFWDYDYENSKSFFRNCQFMTDNDVLVGTIPGTFIDMKEIAGINIVGCEFTDTHDFESVDELTTGIYSFNSGFSIWQYMDQPTLFSGLYDGIRAYSVDPAITVSIKNSEFTENLRSVYLNTQIGAVITGNTFNPWEDVIPIEEPSYCLYLDYCTDYIVEENIFESLITGAMGIGLVINNSGSSNNEIYRNEFTNLQFATMALNCNRSTDYSTGLVIKCNNYSNNYQDISVTADITCQYPGIKRDQGYLGGTNEQAGNLFSLNYNGNSSSDYSTLKKGPINYYHHDPLASNLDRVKPQDISNYIALLNQYTSYIEEISCPPSETGGGGGGSGTGDEALRTSMEISQFKADSTQEILTALVDGGDTEVLEQQVLLSMPQETYDIYLSLMNKSPYLSDSVLMAAIEKENVLPNILIKNILVANPQAAKSNAVMGKVELKDNPFNELFMEEILLGQYIIAAKEKLEANLSGYLHRRSTTLKYLKQLYRNDTINTWAHDSLISVLESVAGCQGKYELAFEYMENGNWAEANNLIISLPSIYSMNLMEEKLYEDFQQLAGVLFDLQQLDSTIYSMPEAQHSILTDLAVDPQNFAGSMARNILIESEGYEYIEPLIFPDESFKSGNIVFDLPNLDTKKDGYANIYPNPALEYVIIELLTGNAMGAEISLLDNLGRQLKTVNIPAWQQNYVMGLKEIPAGMYIIRVESNGKTLCNKKLTIGK